MRHEGLGPERKRANCPSVKILTVTNKWGSAGLRLGLSGDTEGPELFRVGALCHVSPLVSSTDGV